MSNKETVKQVIVVRKDLNMRKGKIASQVAHASLLAVIGEIGSLTTQTSDSISINLDPILKLWLSGNYTKIVVSCDSESELLCLHLQATQAMLRSALVKDSGFTEFHGVPTYTALALGPQESNLIDKITGRLKLL